MKDSTKVRLHLSKQLFESLTREIIKEAKANDGYTVAVKQPKTPKQSKSQATSPEVQKTNKEKSMEEAQHIGPGGVVVDDADWFEKGSKANKEEANKAAEEKKETNKAAGEEKDKVNEFVNTMTANSGVITVIATLLGIGVPLATILVKDLMSAKSPDEKKQIIQKRLSGEKKDKSEDKLNEFTGTETADSGAITALATLLGIGVPLAVGLVKHLRQAKTPEAKKQALQSIEKDLASTTSNKPGQGTDTKASQFSGTKSGEALKEYEQHYEMVNGQCRRYNDEGEYEVVSSHYCR
jgi:hypothetical protein